MDYAIKTGLTIYIIIFLLIIVYFVTLLCLYGYSQLANKDILNKSIGTLRISYWAFTHFIMYAILGYLLPHSFIPLTIIGIFWEFFETLMGSITMPSRIKKSNNSIEYSNWWAGSIKDILINSVGFGFGFLLYKIKTIKREKRNIN